MLSIGLLAPVLIAWWLLGKRRANTLLSLLALASLPMVIWGASLGGQIGPCGVPDCMSSTQHDHLVVSIVALALVLASIGLLAVGRVTLGGALFTVAALVGAYSMATTDVAALIMLIVVAAGAALYMLVVWWTDREARHVPDYPPVA